jgi:hypothetical protein
MVQNSCKELATNSFKQIQKDYNNKYKNYQNKLTHNPKK